jgi:hypothetical protein
MAFWNNRRTRQFLALTLILLVLALSGALAVYADSSERDARLAAHDLAQGDATPTATLALAAAGSGVEAAVLGSADAATATLTVTPTTPAPTRTPTPIPAPGNVIVNGGFEDGFLEGQGVGVGWGRFQNGNVFAGWYDDTWTKVVFEGKHAQLLELRDAKENDRYVGIFQTVNVVPNADYLLTLHGLVRSDPGSPEASNFGYRMQVGIDYKGGTNWESTDIRWVELPWDDQPREDKTGSNQYRMEMYTATVKAQTAKLTLFIRGLKKWADTLEGNYDIDGVSLVGAKAPGGTQPGGTPTATAVPGMPVTGNGFAFLDKPVLAVASAALLVVLAGGAIWGLSRRRT